MAVEKKTMYQILVEKADLCRWNSRRAKTKWAREYWLSTANKLQERADNLPLCTAKCEV